jgi:hypothetical protein
MKLAKIKIISGVIASLVMLVPTMDDCGGPVVDYRSPSHKHQTYPKVQQHDWCWPCVPSHKTKKYKDSLKHDSGGDYCVFGRRIYSSKKC